MAEAVLVSLSAKVAMALGRSTAMGVVTSLGLGGVHSSIAAAEHELSLLRGHLRSGGASCRGADDDDQDPIDSWANQVRDVAFQLDDITDECCFLSGSGSGSGHGFARYCANVPTWIALSRRLRKVREKLGQLLEAANYQRQRVDVMNNVVSCGELRREDDAVAAGRRMAENARSMDKEEIIGFSDHREVLVRWLLAEDAAEPRRRTLLAVCGMGGVGKTTLVASVYKEVTAPAAAPASHHFDCDAWVTVSQRFTMEDLLMKILRKLNLNTVGRRAGTGRRRRRSATDVGDGGGDTDYGSLVAALRERLANKRYLIVLDDVWDETLWDGLERAMPDGDGVAGSRVVITTRKSGVAMAAAPERTMALEPLPTHQGWALLCSVVFKDVPGHRCPSHLREVAGDMLERCRGLPLAIVAVGKLLRHKDRTEFAWRNVRDSLAWVKNSEDLGIGEASRILNLSIDDLPYKLKKCFLSCSIYPEDFLIKRKILIRSWVAQGFIDEAKEVHGERRTMEDVADHYLDKLVQRSLFQVAVRNEFGRAKRFLIHDLIKDLINHRSKHEEGFVQFAECDLTMDSNIRVRHLALDRCTSSRRSASAAKIAALRSFQAFGSKLDASLMSCFRLLTVLNLWFIEINKLPSTVTNLRNLRYLGIRSTFIEELPKDLGKLQKLQTLDTKWSMVQRLPSSLSKLKSLRHLILLKRHAADYYRPYPGTPVGQLPAGLQNLTSLQTLKYVRADEMISKSLAKLEQMKSLELFDVDASFAAVLSSSISKMSHLQRLGITNSNTESVIDLESITVAPRKLQKLALSGRLARGKLPGWTCFLTSLKQVHLIASGIAQDSLLLLSSLPGLLHLSLNAAYREKEMTFAAGGFPALQTLTLHELSNLSQIEFQRGCLAELHELVLDKCTKLADSPKGMENLTRLQNLKLVGMAPELMEKLQDGKGDDGCYYKPGTGSSMICQVPSPSRYHMKSIVFLKPPAVLV